MSPFILDSIRSIRDYSETMPRKAQFDLIQKPNGKWKINLAPTVSPTGRRTAKVFDTKTKAENWIAQRRRYIDRHGAEEVSLSKKQMVDAKRALELLKDRDDNLHDIVREALEARDVLENANLNEGYELSLLKGSRHLVEHYKQREQARTFEEVYQLSMEARGISKKTKQYQTDVGRIMTGPKYKHGQKTPKDGYKEEGFLHHYGSTLIKNIKPPFHPVCRPSELESTRPSHVSPRISGIGTSVF